MIFRTTPTSIALAALAFACTPRLAGVCSSNGDCKTGETCSADGICLRSADGTGNTDGGGDGTASIDILSPASGASEKGQFHVSAHATATTAIHDVTFTLTNSATGAVLGQLMVTTAAGDTWLGDLSVDSSAFGGGADLRAVLHRTGLADVTSAKVSIVIDQNGPSIAPTWDAALWHALDAGLILTAAVGDDRSAVASASLQLPDGGAHAGAIAGSVATFQLPAGSVGTAGAASTVPVSLGASDSVGNQTLIVDAGVIRIDDQPPSISVQALDPALWRNGALDFTATLDDHAGSGPASASLLVGGAFVAGQPDAGGVFLIHTDLSALPPTEAAVSMQVVGADAVGNLADAGFTINVDNVPPTVSAPSIDSTPDAVDLAGNGWFAGPTISPGGGAILISAAVTDTHLSTSPLPAAVVGSGSYPGTLSGGRWHFSIPRSVGLGASAPVTVAFDAQDAAGNHPVGAPTLSINFDDQKSLSPIAPSDSTFHGPSETVTVAVSIAPPSGFPVKTGAVDLAAAGKLSIGSCSGASAIAADATSTFAAYPTASVLRFKIPIGTCVAAGTDGAVSFSAAVRSLVGGTGNAVGTRNVDSRGPVIGNVIVTYPAAVGSGPFSWPYDGSHFTRRDVPSFSFSAYDCHGLGASPASMTVPGFGAVTLVQSTDTSGILNPASTCTPASGITVTRFSGSFNLAQVPSASLLNSETSAVSFAFTVGDAFGNLSTGSVPMNVTRKLWRAASGGPLSFLSLGPRLFAAAAGNQMVSFNPADGTPGVWTIPSDMPLIAPNAGTPAVIYTDATSIHAGNAASSTTSDFGSCSKGDALDSFSLVDASTIAYASHTDTITCAKACTPCTADCWTVTTTNFTSQLQLTAGTSGFSCVPTGPAPTTNCGGATGPGTFSNRVSATVSSATMYVGLNGSGSWTLANASGAPVDTVSSGLAAPGWPLIDGSNPPIVYLPGVASTPGRVDTRIVSTGGFGAGPITLPTFPGAITDMQLAKNGILYVLSNNTVHAVITDSAGGATAAGGMQVSAWPSQCRDPCRSSNAGIQCPY